MNFDTSTLRRFEDTFPVGVRETRESPLILLKPNGTIAWASRAPEKDELREKFDAVNDVLLLAWAGQWRTDVFLVTEDELKKIY
jgi:hypothetical protein